MKPQPNWNDDRAAMWRKATPPPMRRHHGGFDALGLTLAACVLLLVLKCCGGVS